MAAQPVNPLAKPASSILGFGNNPSDELENELAQRRKKALDAANLGGSMPSQMLMGAPPGAP